MMNSNTQTALFMLAFCVSWCVLCYYLSNCGWRQLGLRFATDLKPRGTAFRGKYGNIGSAYYQGCLNFHVSPEGLFISVVWIFRPWHKPLLIPWSEIHDETPYMAPWRKQIQVQVGNPTIARIRLPTPVLATYLATK